MGSGFVGVLFVFLNGDPYTKLSMVRLMGRSDKLHAAMMHLYDPLCNGQSKARAFSGCPRMVAGDKRPEQVLGNPLGNTNAVIGNGHDSI